VPLINVVVLKHQPFVSVKHERRDGLTERRATQRVSLRHVALRSAIAPSVWPCHDIQNHLNHENLGFPRSSLELLQLWMVVFCENVDCKRVDYNGETARRLFHKNVGVCLFVGDVIVFS
jgi:hypothetical protein